MSSRVRFRFSAAAVVVLALLALGSCEFPGFLGESFDIEEQLYAMAGDVLTPVTENGTSAVTFSMMGNPVPILLFSGVYTDGMVSAHVSLPAEASLRTWAEILPLDITVDVSDDSAKACVINSIAIPDWPATAEFRNPASTKWVFWAYSDSDVTLSASGDTTGPGGVAVTLSMDIELKQGWNRINLERTGPGAPYTDTYSVGEMPEDIYLISDIEAKT